MFPHNEATKKHICFISFFASEDANRDGKISENEMAAALKMLNPKISPETQQTAEKVSDGKWQRNRQIRFIVLDGMIGIVLVVVSGMRNIQNDKKTMTRQTADMIIIYYYDSSMEM